MSDSTNKTQVVADNQVVSFNYTLTDADGTVLDQSSGEPLQYLHGVGNIIPGLERQLMGKRVGDVLDVVVEPHEGYGDIDPSIIQQVPRDLFQGVDDIHPGMQFHADSDDGSQVVTVKSVENGMVTIDANHPMAGRTLHFHVEIVDIRPATAVELEHGHAHGADGHHHS